MSRLEDLIGMPLDQVDDSVLEEIAMKGRLSLEEPTPKAKKAAAKKPEIEVDLDDFE